MAKTYSERHWDETSFWSSVWLMTSAYRRFYWSDETSPISRFSALSGTLHTIAGRAGVKFGRWNLWWGALGYFCWKRSEAVSDNMCRLSNRWSVPLDADQLDVRQAILRKAGGRDQDALQCIKLALEQDSIPVHTRALLLVGQAEVTSRMLSVENSEEIQRIVKIAYDAAELAASFIESERDQAIRVFRTVAECMLNIGKISDARYFLGLAQNLLPKDGVADQRKKLNRVERLLLKSEALSLVS
jgi:hypothetical protein